MTRREATQVSSFFYCIGQGIKNLRRNRLFTFASIITITVSIFLFGLMYFVLVNVQFSLNEMEQQVGATVFFREGITTDELISLKSKILEVDGVRSVVYVSPEKAWEDFKKAHFSEDDSELLKSFGNDNPLKNSASFEVYFTSADKQLPAVEAIKAMADDGVRHVKNAEELVNTLTSVNRGLSIGAIVLIVLLIAIAMFLISTTVSIGISVRAREIQIQSLIGATDIFIRAPFLVEGIIIGLLGAGIPLAILYALYYKLIKLIAENLSITGIVNFVSVHEVFSVLIPVALCIGVGIGFFGSYFTLNNELRKFRKM